MHVLKQIHETACADPERTACILNGRSIRYGAFWRMIVGCRESLAPRLPAEGIVVVCAVNLLESWILALAVRSLGHDVVAVQSRAQVNIFNDLDVRCILSLASETDQPIATRPGVAHILVEDPSEGRVFPDGPPPPCPQIGKPGGNIMLTSGTTGRYKRVLSDFGGRRAPLARTLARYAEWGERIVQLDDRTVFNMFDMAIWAAAGQLYPMLVWAVGGAVLFQQTEDAHRALAWPGLTHTVATPLQLLKLFALADDAFASNPQMQLIVVAGGLSPSQARDAARRLTPRILVGLGSTEVGAWARSLVESDADLRWYLLYPDRRVEVLDEAGEPLGAGVLGRVRIQLCDGDATGYLGDPEATSAFFDKSWFYPGDLGVLDGAGRIEVRGRTSDVVSVNGAKLPAEPWERAIQEKLGCDAVCVISGRWGADVEQLHVFIEARRVLPVEEIRQALESTLSGFAQIHFHVVTQLPRTETGKVRRIALAQSLHDTLPARAQR